MPYKPGEVIHRLVIDRSEKLARLVSYQDAEPIIEDNKIWQADKQTGDFRKVATIGNTQLFAWLTEENARGNPMTYGSHEFWDMVDRKINDPDFKKYRTT
jgi:hypothetical protein